MNNTRFPVVRKLSYALPLTLLLTATLTRAATAQNFQANGLVSDGSVPAAHTDPDLINPWGISFAPNGAFWVSDNGTGKSTLYNGQGVKLGLIVSIPHSATPTPGFGTLGQPTGQVFTGGLGFTGSPNFAFVSEDGALTTWSGGTTATIQQDLGASNAVFKGMAVAQSGGNSFLYATDFHNAKVDVFNTAYQLQSTGFQFNDPAAIAGYAPFNIQLLSTAQGSKLFVSYAKQDAAGHDEIAGAGLGYVNVFNTDGTGGTRVTTGAATGNLSILNAPWGMAIAPTGFGPYGGDLLVGNFGNGEIAAFNPLTNAFVGALQNALGTGPLAIQGLWAISPGTGSATAPTSTLFFDAGSNGQTGGLFGSITPVVAAAAPEPDAFALIASLLPGIIGLAVVCRKKRVDTTAA